MASSSCCSSPRTWRYQVFASFHGADVRKTFLSHLRKQFNYNGITMFDDQGIERSQIISPALTRAIRESKISLLLLSKNYASSSWCLDELLEILKCREDNGQIVMTVFYGVDPSDVRKQTGEFGSSFNETCARKTEKERRKWSQALNYVGNIAGEHSLNWDNESNMIEKIARDVSNKLNATPARDFEDMVGLEAHLNKLQALLHLDNEDGAMIVGICGPAGIGKTTIARALHSRLSNRFQLTCFMENIRGSCNSGLDEYGLKLCLQEQLLSKILKQIGMRIYHLGTIQERLCDQKVLVILDDVDNRKQLEALADEKNWFGHGSRIIVTTENEEILEKHGINITYHVYFPTREEAHKIFCRYAFRQSSAPDGFEKLVERVTNLCSNLPLGLRVMGSSLCGKKENEWEVILRRLENSLDRDIEGVLRVGYDTLHINDQFLFLLIAFFFNYQENDYVEAMLGDCNLDVILGLKTLAYKSLIQISTKGSVVMHKLLQQVGREAVQRQEPGKRRILIHADEIHDVLENDTGSRSVMGISFDISTISYDMNISAKAFKSMRYLQFLNVYMTNFDSSDRVHLPEDMDLPPRLRLLHWDVYPRKCLPRTFCSEYLVKLNLRYNQLEKLWEGNQPLPNLKKMDLLGSLNLKKLPDLSNATNLESLILTGCKSLVEISSSIGNLHKLELLDMGFCTKLHVVPIHFDLASLESVYMVGCSQLRKFPNISKNITSLHIADTMLEELPESVWLWSRLQRLGIFGSVTTFRFAGKHFLERSGADIEKIPDWIKDLHGLKELYVGGCPKLASLPELPGSLRTLIAETCESLETISFPIDSLIELAYLPNSFQLGQEAQRAIIKQSGSAKACLPGRNIPAEFNHPAIRNSLTIRSNFYGFRICVVVSPKQQMEEAHSALLCRIHLNGSLVDKNIVHDLPYLQTEHLFIFQSELFDKDGWLEQDNEILFEFSTTPQDINIIECGVQILTYKPTEAEAAR
ncbi:PREDICTED: disease resistance protein RML1A [Camelina sativa]|uniref:Disease resistance protein RML1A n=1 Tax=Camelina sativa TaxID=90675 RepID=A0ABM1QEQ3_CAMSA|nr:PREDICTED: disease resistance protein RML1A [Camelina sativa]